MVTPCFESMGNITLDGFLIQNIAEIQSIIPLFANFIFRKGRFFVSVLSHTLTALNSLFEEMSKIIL